MPHFSIFSWFGFSIPMEERFRLIKAAGFDEVLLWWSDDHADVDGERWIQPDLARTHGLFVENIHTPFKGINCLWEDSLAGDAFEKILADCIADCFTFSIPTAVVHLSQGNAPPPPNPVGLDRIKRLVDLAERKNINIALENLRRLEYLEFIFSKIDSKRLGFCYDSGHAYCYTPGMDPLSFWGDKLMALHLHDNDSTDDQHQIPGSGTINWTDIGKKIRKTGYKGPISLEVLPHREPGKIEETPEHFLGRALAAGRTFFDIMNDDNEK